jgi:hypothetical protein
VQHLAPVQGLQALGELLDDGAHAQRGLGLSAIHWARVWPSMYSIATKRWLRGARRARP